MDETYRDFGTEVDDARRRNFAQIEPLARGRVWLGSQAKPRDLVDEIGGLDKALEMGKQKAKIPARERVRLMILPGRPRLLDLFIKKSKDDMLGGKIGHVLGRVPFHPWVRCG